VLWQDLIWTTGPEKDSRGRRRSRSDVPPQNPIVSLSARASLRHSGWTLHVEQMARAAALTLGRKENLDRHPGAGRQLHPPGPA
jgi:hypothetical protein